MATMLPIPAHIFVTASAAKNARVILRADLNVPLKNGSVLDDHRLQALLPTLHLLHAYATHIVIITHLGRPHGYDPALSTRHLIPWFAKYNYSVYFAATLEQAYELTQHNTRSIILLENLRFFPGEKGNDPTFAHQLAQLGDTYVNDAFGSLHRADCSLVQLPFLFPPNKRFLGLLIHKELHMLDWLRINPAQPFVLLLGGGKVSDKLVLLDALIDKVSTILLGPAIVFSFLHAQGKPTGSSLVDPRVAPLCLQILAKAAHHKVTVEFPVDYRVTRLHFSAPLEPHPISADNFPKTACGMTLGPATTTRYATILAHAKTVLINGLMGTVQRPETLVSMATLYQTLEKSNAVRVIGGGDSVAAARRLGFNDTIGYLSTGGGATLSYLQETVPVALKPFID